MVKEPDDLVSETASKCVLFLIDKLGPRVTAKNIVTGLLAQTVHCFETAKTPDLVHIGKCFFHPITTMSRNKTRTFKLSAPFLTLLRGGFQVGSGKSHSVKKPYGDLQ